MKIHCYICMDRRVEHVGDECGTCKYKAWKKAEHQLFHTSRQKGKVTTEEVHEGWRAPEWMIEAATQGAHLKELSWGWELRGPSGQRQSHPKV